MPGLDSEPVGPGSQPGGIHTAAGSLRFRVDHRVNPGDDGRGGCNRRYGLK
jgi:hypothetical protein